MKLLYNIIEVANVHAGDENYMHRLIDDFADVEGVNGIKFQPFKYDKIALDDFPWYDVYKELFFDEKQWKGIIQKAAKHWDIWIDTFDDYSFEIARDNFEHVYGFKFQASTLYNKNLIALFTGLDLSQKKVILNISGLSIEQITQVVQEFETKIKPGEIILQIGFQSYPTEFIDSGLSKIDIIKNTFNNKISFADHITPTEPASIHLPVSAYLKGAAYIEKHICLSGDQPKYDFYSSMHKQQYLDFMREIKNYEAALAQPFVNSNEARYLTNSIQIPILKKSLQQGTIPHLERDFQFKRSKQVGLRAHEIEKYIQDLHILSTDKKANTTIHSFDFKKANIATIIAGRLKSTRLPSKATSMIGELSSVELCIKNCLRFKRVNHTILATSTTEQDQELKNHTFAPAVLFHAGDPDDVIRRYLDVVDVLKIDVIIRVTADNPFVSDDILQHLLESHFRSGADYTSSRKAAIGTSPEIINASALKYLKSFFPNANYSEYMTWYFMNNQDHFKINIVDLPSSLVRDYRLTLDYQEDLDMFRKIEEHFSKNNLEYNITELFQFLDANPEIANINSHLTLAYKTDQSLIDQLNEFTKIPEGVQKP
jgi:N,N'-diacetyllegionaminate synthase